MADLSITATSVVKGANARTVDGVAGETVAAGQLGYKAAATGKWMKSDADSATAEARDVHGIFLNGASLNQPVEVQTFGDITLGATLTVNTPYYLSGATAGGICPIADVGAGEYLVQVGIARTAAILELDIHATGVAN